MEPIILLYGLWGAIALFTLILANMFFGHGR